MLLTEPAARALAAIHDLSNSDIEQMAAASHQVQPNVPERSVAQSLARLFPTFGSATTQQRGRSSSGSPVCCGKKRKSKTSKQGRPISDVVYKDLVLCPYGTEDVPTHKKRVVLEREARVIHEIPLQRSWTASELRKEFKKHLPVEQRCFEFVKVSPCHPTCLRA